MSQPPEGSRSSDRKASGQPRQPDLNTDPGRRDPYERLYRGPSRSHNSPPTQFQPAMSPPEGAAESGDQYGYLYRPESDRPTVPPKPPEPVLPGEPPMWVQPARDPKPVPQSRVVQTAPEPVGPSVEDEPPRRRSRVALIAVLLILLMVLAIAAGALLPRLLGGGSQANPDSDKAPATFAQRSTNPSASGRTPPAESDQPTSGEPYQGEVAAVVPSAADVDCQAPPATDAAGKPVNYAPPLMFDGDNQTAWRCDGDGNGRTLTFTFSAGTQLAELGLVNGYSKVDPSTKDDRYHEYRRITEVTWTLNGETYKQKLKDGTEEIQSIRIPVTEATEVSLLIKKSTKPGEKAKTRDAVLISEVGFGAPRR